MSSAKSFPKFFPNFKSYRCILTRGVDQSLAWGMILCHAQRVSEGDVPPQKMDNFVFWKLESRNLVNTFGRKFRAGDYEEKKKTVLWV